MSSGERSISILDLLEIQYRSEEIFLIKCYQHILWHQRADRFIGNTVPFGRNIPIKCNEQILWHQEGRSITWELLEIQCSLEVTCLANQQLSYLRLISKWDYWKYKTS
jgi:hypothetical protein